MEYMFGAETEKGYPVRPEKEKQGSLKLALFSFSKPHRINFLHLGTNHVFSIYPASVTSIDLIKQGRINFPFSGQLEVVYSYARCDTQLSVTFPMHYTMLQYFTKIGCYRNCRPRQRYHILYSFCLFLLIISIRKY